VTLKGALRPAPPGAVLGAIGLITAVVIWIAAIAIVTSNERPRRRRPAQHGTAPVQVHRGG
jgi:hypothetical protein